VRTDREGEANARFLAILVANAPKNNSQPVLSLFFENNHQQSYVIFVLFDATVYK
jgi:hypothetical protein